MESYGSELDSKHQNLASTRAIRRQSRQLGCGRANHNQARKEEQIVKPFVQFAASKASKFALMVSKESKPVETEKLESQMTPKPDIKFMEEDMVQVKANVLEEFIHTSSESGSDSKSEKNDEDSSSLSDFEFYLEKKCS